MNKLILIIALVLGIFFRLNQLQSNPPGFYSDEASYAYNAYSILETGKDEYARSYPLVFEAFGDYKLPVMLYSIVGSFAVFGVSEWSARLPGALFGLGSILLTYFLVKQFLHLQHSNQKPKPIDELITKYLPAASALILAVTPSHIFVSRGTWELTPALFFILLGTSFFLKYIYSKSEKISWLLILLSTISFVLALYSYNTARLFVPLYGFALAIIFRNELFQTAKLNKYLQYAAVIVIAIFLSLPILRSLTRPEVLQRAKYISIFYDKGVDGALFDAIRSDSGQPVLQTRILHNKVVFYGSDFLKRYLSHFDPNYLFTIGDTFEIFQLIGLGILPLFTIIFLPIGVYQLFLTRPKWFKLILAWLLISPIASSFTIFTPSSSRAMNMVIPLTIFSSYGLIYAYFWTKQKKIFLYSTSIVMIIFSIYLYKQYFLETPKIVAEKWNDGFESTVNFVKENQNNYDSVVISSAQAPSYIFYLWYMRYDPSTYQHQAVVDHHPDEHGLNFTSQFGKYIFTKNIKEVQTQKDANIKTLFVGFPNELTNVTDRTYSRNGKIVNEISR